MLSAFLKESYVYLRPYAKAVLILFAVSIVIGIVTFGFYPELLIKILNVFKDKFGADPSLNFALVLNIFKQNLIASLIGLFGGVLLGLGSIIFILFNGFIIGYIVTAMLVAGSQEGIITSIKYLILGLAPHGIVEIPAFLLASAIGLRLGLFYLKKQNKGIRLQIFLKDLKLSIVAIPIIVILLFIAALLEVYATGSLLEWNKNSR